MLEKKQKTYLSEGKKRSEKKLKQFNLNLDSIIPTGDKERLKIKIRGENDEEINYIHMAINEFIKYVYNKGTYRVKEDANDEIMTQKVIPILLHLAYLFKENSLAINCERILAHNLIITPFNCHNLFGTMRTMSDRLKRTLITNLIQSMTEFTQFEIIEQWNEDIVNIIYDVYDEIIGYSECIEIIQKTQHKKDHSKSKDDKEKKEKKDKKDKKKEKEKEQKEKKEENMLIEIEINETHLPNEMKAIHINEINIISLILLISLINKNSPKRKIVSQLCFIKLNTLLNRKDICSSLFSKGARDLLPIISTCFVGVAKATDFKREIDQLINTMMQMIVSNYTYLSFQRGYCLVNAQAFDVVCTQAHEKFSSSDKNCYLCGTALGMMNKQCELCNTKVCKKCLMKVTLGNGNNMQRSTKIICYGCHRIWQYLSPSDFYQPPK